MDYKARNKIILFAEDMIVYVKKSQGIYKNKFQKTPRIN